MAGLPVAWVVARFKSVPGVVARAVATVLFGWLGMASDVYTTNGLFGLGHDGSAYALLTMVGLNVAMQVAPLCRYAAPRPAPLGEANNGIGHIGWLGLAPQALLAVMMTKHRGLWAVSKELAMLLTAPTMLLLQLRDH